jgi:hypothetical protein
MGANETHNTVTISRVAVTDAFDRAFTVSRLCAVIRDASPRFSLNEFMNAAPAGHDGRTLTPVD